MKACPECGLDLEDSYLFCPEDGSPLNRPESTALAEQLPETPPPAAGPTSSIAETGEDAARPVVLYCPACAAEYPLTFSDCPVHGVPLTKHRVPTFVKPVEEVREPLVIERDTRVPQEAVSSASHVAAFSGNAVEPQSLSAPASLSQFNEPVPVGPYREAQGLNLDYENPAETEGPADSDRRSFRIAAIIVTVGLALLSLAGLYTFYVNATRKSATIAAKSPARPLPVTPESAFIPTPEEARDYKEEPQKPSETDVASRSDESGNDKDTRTAKDTLVASAAAPSKQASPSGDARVPQPPAQRQPMIATQAPTQAKASAGATDLVLPRGTYGLIDARLIRMRARQTPSGFRYDLTFNLQEQAGRTTQYERLAVVTRSASGINHSQAMPFFHRLGAAGTLTFTVSVEMKGRAETDWQGRIICTSIGTDTEGKPLRTSFGANVSPW